MYPPVDSNLLYLLCYCGETDVNPTFDVRRSDRYPYCLIHYVHTGTLYVEYGRERFEVHSGESFLLPAYSAHHYYASVPAHVTWAEFYGVNSQTILDSIAQQHGIVINRHISCKLLHHMYCLIPVPPDFYDVSRVLSQLLTDLMQSLSLVPVAKSALQQAVEYIHSHPGDQLDTKMLAGLCGYSPSYFSRLFHRTYGTTVSQYIAQQRLELAKRLLENPSYSIAQIAESAGFSDSSHLIKSFRDAYGETPGMFRRHLSMYRSYAASNP